MRVYALVLAVAVVACGGTTSVSSPTPSASGGTGTPSPAPGGLTEAQLKYRIVDQFGQLLFCDPDYYPVARADEQVLAHERFPAVQSDVPTFTAIAARLGISTTPPYTADQELAIYRDWKMLSALFFEQVGAGFRFTGVFDGPSNTPTDLRVEGTIDPRGSITIASQTPSGPPQCPICLARGTRIATPSGDIAVEDLRIGDLVWTLDATGARIAAPLVEIGSTPVSTHRVVQLLLSDGRAVDVSPGHPTADGRTVGDLVAADLYDGSVVLSAELIAYAGGVTFDVLPAGATGIYWANGVLLGSTLR
jgi:hypothetical protein